MQGVCTLDESHISMLHLSRLVDAPNAGTGGAFQAGNKVAEMVRRCDFRTVLGLCCCFARGHLRYESFCL